MGIPEPAISADEMRAWAALFETSNIVQYAADRNLRDTVGLTLAQFEILLRIGEAGIDGRRMTDIADSLTVSRSGLTYQVGQLERKGLVLRRPAPDDDRSVIAQVTPAGVDVLRAGIPGYVALVREMLFDRLSHTDLMTVTEILDDVRRQLKEQPKRSTYRRTRARSEGALPGADASAADAGAAADSSGAAG
jgi:DNA-binding MarR family transcriptional regulator